MPYYNNNASTTAQQPEGGELTDSAVFSADQLGDYDRGGFVLLPEGDYDFTIIDLKESRHQARPGGKVGSCKQVNPVFRVTNPEDGSPVDLDNYNLFMWNSKGCIGMIAQYYDSIGLHKKGDPIRFDWIKEHHIGKTGRLEIKHEAYKGRDGSDKVSAKIARLYPKEEAQQQSQNVYGSSWGNWKK